MLVVSYNPGYQSVLKTLKPRRRLMALEFDFPPPDREAVIVADESGLKLERCRPLVQLAGRFRALKGQDLEEGVSMRLLIYCASLMAQGMKPDLAVRAALGWVVVCPQSMGILGGEAGYQSGLGGLAGKDLASDDLGGPFWRQLCGEAEWLCRRIQGLSMALRQTRPWPAAAGILRIFWGVSDTLCRLCRAGLQRPPSLRHTRVLWIHGVSLCTAAGGTGAPLLRLVRINAC